MKFLDLGRQPLANNYLSKDQFASEYFYDLEVAVDRSTRLVSLVNKVDASMMFNESYPYHSSSSRTMIKHFESAATKIKAMHPRNLLEIGSNDGIFIRHFDKKKVVAIEPCKNFSDYTNNLGYVTYNRYWDCALASELLLEYGRFHIIYAANSIPHINDIEETFKAVSILLESDGSFVIECPWLASIIKSVSYDQWYNEHPHTLSCYSINAIASKYDMEVYDCETLDVHGGSIRVYVGFRKMKRNFYRGSLVEKHEEFLGDDATYEVFSYNTKASKDRLLEDLYLVKRAGGKVVAYGATAKSSTVFNYCGITTDLIDCIIDTTPEKQGKYSPGVHIPIVQHKKDLYGATHLFLSAWNYRDEIVKKEKEFIKRGGKLISHIRPTK